MSENRTRQSLVNSVYLSKLQGFHDNISKAYYVHAVKYGDYLDVRTYHNVKITFNGSNNNHVKREKGNKRSDSLSRSRNFIYRLVHANCYAHGQYRPVFTTYTFKEPVEDITYANLRFKYFMRRLNDYVGHKIKYIVVPEVQKEREKKTGFAVWHFHAVIFNLPFINAIDHEKLWGHGFCDIQTVKSINDIGAYISKYLSKDIIDSRLYGKKVYYTSRGLVRPIEFFHSEEVQNILNNAIPIIKGIYEGTSYTQIKYKLM